MISFDKKEVLLLHELVIQKSGGKTGVRDLSLLESALGSAFQTFDGIDLYPSDEEKAARLGYSIICNHAFIDGNKRTGLLVMLTYLNVNGINMKYSDNELIEISFSLASGKADYHTLLDWVNCHKVENKKTSDCEIERI